MSSFYIDFNLNHSPNYHLNALQLTPNTTNQLSQTDCEAQDVVANYWATLFLSPLSLSLSLSPVFVIWDGGQRRVEAVDVERHVTLVAQQLHVSVLLPPTHAARAEATLGVRVGLAVLTLRPALPWIPEWKGNICSHMRTWSVRTLLVMIFSVSRWASAYV